MATRRCSAGRRWNADDPVIGTGNGSITSVRSFESSCPILVFASMEYRGRLALPSKWRGWVRASGVPVPARHCRCRWWWRSTRYMKLLHAIVLVAERGTVLSAFKPPSKGHVPRVRVDVGHHTVVDQLGRAYIAYTTFHVICRVT